MKKLFTLAQFGILSAMCNAPVGDDECAVVDGFSKPNADIMKEIKEEEEKRVRDEQKNAAKNQLQIDSYKQESEAIELRYKRAESEAYAAKLKARTAENNAYTEGGVDTEVHKANLEKIEKTYNDAIEKANKERCKALDNLRQRNPRGYDRSRWGY